MATKDRIGLYLSKVNEYSMSSMLFNKVHGFYQDH